MTLAGDETFDVCPACQHVVNEIEVGEFTDEVPCEICMYPHEFNVELALEPYAEDIGSQLLNGELTYGQAAYLMTEAKINMMRRIEN